MTRGALSTAAQAAFAVAIAAGAAAILFHELERSTMQMPQQHAGPWFVEPAAQIDDREVYFVTRRAGPGAYETLRTPLGQPMAFDTVDAAHDAIAERR